MPHVVLMTWAPPGGDEPQVLWRGKLAALPRKGDTMCLHGKRFGELKTETYQLFEVESVVFNVDTDADHQLDGDDTTELQIYLNVERPSFQPWCERFNACRPLLEDPTVCERCGGKIR